MPICNEMINGLIEDYLLQEAKYFEIIVLLHTLSFEKIIGRKGCDIHVLQ